MCSPVRVSRVQKLVSSLHGLMLPPHLFAEMLVRIYWVMAVGCFGNTSCSLILCTLAKGDSIACRAEEHLLA